MDLYSSYIHQSRYARWLPELSRRETWQETVDRYVTFIDHQVPGGLTESELGRITAAIEQLDIMPSMRAMMTAGPALERDNAAGYNCVYIAVDHPRAFDEAVYLTMCGCGVGFSVERQYVRKLPGVPRIYDAPDDVIAVKDSRKSWAASVRKLMAALWAGHCPSWDLTRIRPAGSPLETFGGRASGAAPLDQLLRHIVQIMKGAQGRQLTSLECHSIMCMVGSVINSGDVRRAAMISLSNPSDDRMRYAKHGNWHAADPHFAYANNSGAWTDKPDPGRFMAELQALYASKSGERGIVNRAALQDQAGRFGRRDPDHEFGVNPCGEILLRSCQMCNLSEIVARPGDDLADLLEKAEIAAILGTIQSTLTDFDYLRSIWRKNCEEERLLGVSITGQMDHPILGRWDDSYSHSDRGSEWLEEMRQRVVETNAMWAERLGVNASAATTCQKPSGNVSQLVNASSGGHPRWSPFYLRRTRESKMSPVAHALIAAGVPYEQDVYSADNWVFEWPVASPKGAVTNEDMSAIDQLERWLYTRTHWCEHNPSATVTIMEDEWVRVGAWIYDHFDAIGGLAFLPFVNSYAQPPYERITQAEYERRAAVMPTAVDWTAMVEAEDTTVGSQELACSASGGCEL